MENMKVTKRLSAAELFEMFKRVNPTVKAIDYEPLQEILSVSNLLQPSIRVECLNGDWYRVYVSNKYQEIEWY